MASWVMAYGFYYLAGNDIRQIHAATLACPKPLAARFFSSLAVTPGQNPVNPYICGMFCNGATVRFPSGRS